MGYYTRAQICINGHMITTDIEYAPELSKKFCNKCGAVTIECCEKCKSLIQGEYTQEINGQIFSTIRKNYVVPLYCNNCGVPYPWTKSAIDAITEIINEDDDLFEDEKEKISKSLPDILSETPRTSLAVTRIKKAAVRCGKYTAKAIYQFAIDFGCEVVKKQLGL